MTKIHHSYCHRYSVPVVLQDLPPAEALGQTFDNLKHLDNVINDVFKRLTDRISTERGRLKKINERVAAASGKVVQISQNQSRVTLIRSSSKYPASKVLPDFQQLCPATGVSKHDLMLPETTTLAYTKAQREASSANTDTNDMFYDLSSHRAAEVDHEKDEEMKEGLGRLPDQLFSVSSILLFNSDENPYKKYQSINNLEGVAGIDKEETDVSLAVAPHSLLEGTSLPIFGTQAFDYKPEMQELPTFIMPTNLPLSRLADISYNSGDLGSIAPSVASLPSLPTLEALPAPAKVYQASPSVPDMIPEAPAAPSSGPAPAPPGPPAPPSSAPPPPGPPGPPGPPAPGPPGPPGPPTAPTAPAAPKPPAGPSTPSPAPASDGGGGRGGLLAAIRNKKMLKKVAETTERPAVKAPEDSGGGDMMSALKNRLASMRAVTSGKGKAPAPSKSESLPKISAPEPDDDGDDWDT